jgi:hypothetical protein
MGTARGKTHESWRPRTFSVVGLPSIPTVSCSMRMVATGLKPRGNRCPVLADAALYSAAMVCGGRDAAVVVNEDIVLLTPCRSVIKSLTILESLNGIDGEHGTPSGRAACQTQAHRVPRGIPLHTGNDPSDGVTAFFTSAMSSSICCAFSGSGQRTRLSSVFEGRRDDSRGRA